MKKEIKEILENNFLIATVRAVGIIILIILLTIGYRYYQVAKIDDVIISEVRSLEEVYNNNSKVKGRKKVIENFDLSSDSLPFANFKSKTSPGGNCEGYNIYEMLYFNNQLESFLGKDKKTTYVGNLGELELLEEDVNLVYTEGAYYYKYDVEETEKTPKDYKKIIKKAYGLGNNEKYKIEQDFTDKEFKNKEFKNILEDIIYLQDNKGYISYRTLPYNSTSPGDKIKGNEDKYDKADVSLIKETIDNNKLIEVAIMNGIGGHSFLAYGYEYIDDNNIKIYVKDSNLPLIHKATLTEDDKRINKEIEENCYILFTKDILKDDWSYIYQPIINGKELYGYFNSFVPGTNLSIVKM